MNRKIAISIVLIVVLMLIFAACGGGDEEEAAPATEAPAAAPTDTPVPTAALEPTEATPAEEPAAEEPAAEEPAEEAPPAAELSGDPVRGGTLYDKWWPILGVDAPEADHPLWATQDTNTRSGSDTWRCKECHGWDYKGADGAYGSGSHLTGFAGLLEAAAQGSEYVLSTLMGETNSDHDFSDVLAEQDLADIALFIADTTTDYDAWIDSDKMAIDGSMEDGQLVYEELCTGCHGPEGTAINFSGDDSDSEYVAVIASGNPWEFLHKVRYGQPATAMPSGIDVGLSDQEYADLLAHAQGLSQEAPALVGGRLYDKWWAALNIDAPEGDQPLWATQDTNNRAGSDTWRCKECHGWDYKGADGAYGSGSHATGFLGILDSGSMPAEEIAGWLDGTANPDHNFSEFMDESQIAMLAAFMQTGLVDTSEYINEDKSANGDPAAGEKLYNVACTRCHGDDGHAINFGDEAEPEYLPDIATGNPWEFWHKASYGQPGENMPAGIGAGWTLQDIADVLSYAQTLAAGSE